MKLIDRKKYLEGLPRKRMGAGVLLQNKEGEILLLKPSYKDHWTVPGGVVEKDESPRQTVAREMLEEIGLEVKVGQLLVVSYNFESKEFDENIQWMFDGGVLSDEQINIIKIDNEEIIDWKFVAKNDLDSYVRKDFSRRMEIVEKARKLGAAIYLENWKEV